MNYTDKHKGKTAIVAGSGPSLRHVDAKLTEGCIVIAVNGAILKFPNVDYFFSCDARCTLRKSWLTVRESRCEIVSAGGFSTYDKLRGESYKKGIENRVTVVDRVTNKNLKMEVDCDKLIMGSSSAHCAVHLAHILGCSPIVLLGMDCCTEDGKQRFNDFEGQPDDGLFKEEFRPHVKDDNPIVGTFCRTWENIAKANPGINIINASGGKLEAFPRMKLAEAIKQDA